MSRTLAIGDVHGCLRALETMEAWLEFADDDRIVLLGDYVNRGPDTRGVIDWLIDRSRTKGVFSLRGNHDVVMLAARNSENMLNYWRRSGGDAALRSYASDGSEGTRDDIPREHWQFLESALLPCFETDTHLFAHAGMLPDCPIEQQPEDVLFWTSSLTEDFVPHQSGKLLIVGHAAQQDGVPKSVPGCVGIDTWACGGGWLTCLDVDTGQYWQTNQQGQQRQGDHRLPISVS